MKRTSKQIQGRPYVSPRTFFDEASHEYSKKPFSYKVDRLKEYVSSGYSLRRWIIEYRNYYNDGNHRHMEGYLEQSLNTYIHYFKTSEINHFYDKNPYSGDLIKLIDMLEDVIKKVVRRENLKFNETEIRALLTSYLSNPYEYEILSNESGIDFKKDISEQLQTRDNNEGVKPPLSYLHLNALLQHNIIYALRENDYSQLYPQMGCSTNQLYYLKKFSEMTKDKTTSYKREVALDIALELIKILYFKSKQVSA